MPLAEELENLATYLIIGRKSLLWDNWHDRSRELWWDHIEL